MSTRIARVVLCALTVVLSAATSTAGQDRPSPQMSRDWKRVRTENFVVVGNAGQNELVRAAGELEAFGRTLQVVYPSMTLSTHVPTVLVVFKSDASFGRFKPRDERGKTRQYVAGYFSAHPDVVYMVLGAEERREQTYQVVFHEYTHFILHHNLRVLPQWLNEGLSEFYSTFEGNYRDGQSLLGRYVEGRVQTLRQGRPLLPLKQLMTAEGAYNLTRNQHTVGMFYAQAWALVHYLQLGHKGKRERQLTAYLRAIESGRSVEDAFSTAFATTFEGLERELYEYVQGRAFPAVLVNAGAGRAATTVQAEAMTEAEVRYLQGDLLLRVGAAEDADEEIAKALALDGNHFDARVAQTRLWMQQGRTSEAVSALQSLTSANASHFTGQLYLAAALREERRFDEALAAYDRAIKLNPHSASAWFGLSLSALSLSRSAQADAALANVLAIDSNPAWLRSRAYAAYELEQHATVVRDAAAYVSRTGHGNESAPYVAFLAALSHRKMKKPEEAAKVLDAVRDSIMTGSWTERVMSFMSGTLPATEFLSKAKTNGEQTEAHAYIGIMAAIDGNAAVAIPHLRWVRDRGSKNFVEYPMALVELRKLEPSAK